MLGIPLSNYNRWDMGGAGGPYIEADLHCRIGCIRIGSAQPERARGREQPSCRKSAHDREFAEIRTPIFACFVRLKRLPMQRREATSRKCRAFSLLARALSWNAVISVRRLGYFCSAYHFAHRLALLRYSLEPLRFERMALAGCIPQLRAHHAHPRRRTDGFYAI